MLLMIGITGKPLTLEDFVKCIPCIKKNSAKRREHNQGFPAKAEDRQPGLQRPGPHLRLHSLHHLHDPRGDDYHFSFQTYGAIRMKKLDLSNWTLVNFFGSEDYQYLTEPGHLQDPEGLHLRPVRQRGHPGGHQAQLCAVRHRRRPGLRHCGGGLQLHL